MSIYQKRLGDLRREMTRHNVDVYYIPTADPHLSEYTSPCFQTRTWLTGFTGSAGTAVITQNDAVLFTDGRYFIQADSQLKDSGYHLIKLNTPGEPSVSEYIKANLEEGKTLAFNGLYVSQEFAESLIALASAQHAKTNGHIDIAETMWSGKPALPTEPIWRLLGEYSGETMMNKHKRLRSWLSEQNADYALFSTLDDIAWLYNLRGGDISHTPVFLAYALIDQNNSVLFLNQSSLSDDLRRLLTTHGVTLKDYSEIFKAMASLNQGTIVLAKNKTNHRLYDAISSALTVLDLPNWTQQQKACKNQTEIANERIAFTKDGVTLTKFICWLKNHTEIESLNEFDTVTKLAELRREQEHFVDESFATIAAYGANAAMMHYSPDPKNSTNLHKQDFLLVDSGGHYLEGSTDITRTISLGTLTEAAKRYYTLTLKGHIALSSAVFLKGTTGYYLDALARQPLWQHRIDYKSGTGHGIGYCLCVHESPPRIANSPACLDALAVGMMVSNEPGVYITGEIGIRLENILTVVPDSANDGDEFLRFEDLTIVPFDRDAIDVALLTDAELSWINDYQARVFTTLEGLLDPTTRRWLEGETAVLDR